MLPLRTHFQFWDYIMSLNVNKKRSGQGETKYRGTVSDEVTTAGTNQEVPMLDDSGDPVVVGLIAFRFTHDTQIRFNDESNVHKFKADDTFSYTDMAVRKFTIVESGVTVDYKGEHF